MRYAVYYTPDPRDPLAVAAQAWLGRGAWSEATLEQPRLDWLGAADLAALTADPRRYGFHATLKPPFRLAPGRREEDLERHLSSLAAGIAPVVIDGGLAVSALGPFLALVPAGPSAGPGRLAEDCVRALDPYRAEPTQEELARRRGAGLSPRQEALLLQWGYPYVFEEFRFHMTLTGPVPDRWRHPMQVELSRRFADAIARPIAIDRLVLFVQSGPDRPFVARQAFPLASGRRRPAEAGIRQ